MTNFLEEAMEQEEKEEREKEVPFEFGSVGNQVLGDSFVQKSPPEPQKAPEGESFDPLPLWTPPLNDQKRGHCDDPSLETPHSRAQDGGAAPAPYCVTGPGLDRREVPIERVQTLKSKVQRAEAEDPVIWNHPRAVLTESRMAQPAYAVTPAGARNRRPERLGEAVRRVERAAAPETAVREPARRREGALTLLAAVRRAEESLVFVRGQRRKFTVTVPETAGDREGGLTVDALDRAVERDARRYDGETMLY